MMSEIGKRLFCFIGKRVTDMIFHGNRSNYGEPIGILMNDTHFPRVPGDIGNANTFRFPVRYKLMKGAWYGTVVADPDYSFIQKYIDAANELADDGCKAVATSCGFLALFHKEVSSAVKVPFISSSLLQVKYVHDLLPKGKKVGIVTVNSEKLTQRHFEAVGISDIPMAVAGLQGTYLGELLAVHRPDLDYDKAEKSMLDVTAKLCTENPDIGALVFECTNMPPYSHAVQMACKVPVFNIITLINYVAMAVDQQPYSNYQPYYGFL